MPQNHLPKVKNPHEALPCPPCNPQDERQRLVMTWLEDLPMINHYCFAGRQSFEDGFRALVAGGGTGDATIFLAEQLRATDAEIVHLDISHASMVLAQARAKIRGLTNITWVHYSLLSLPALGLGKFDYINCSGVLHHLADPDLGLRVLLSALKPDGAIGLTLPASTGRTGVRQMQALMRLVNGDGTAREADDRRKIANTREMLASLPASNWFMRAQGLHHGHTLDDAGLHELLHSQERSYSVGELFDWLGTRHGRHLAFSDVQRGRAPYLPHMVLGGRPPAMAAELRRLPLRQQYEMAELMSGNILTHSLYLTRDAGCTAPYGEAACVPFFYHEPLTGALAAQVFGSNRGQPFRLTHQHSGVSLMVNPGKYGAKILGLIDGRKSFGEIFDAFRAGWRGQAAAPDNTALFADFAESYDTLNALERLLLKQPAAAAG